MKKFGLKPITWRTFVRTTDSRHALPVYPNLIKNRQVHTVNQVWVADITYIRIRSSFVYLAAILDLYSRRIVGWAISKRIDTELCVAALRMALETRRSHGCIHHSDRGVQYASAAYVALLRQYGLLISMSAKGNPYDNAFMESFYKTLKYEECISGITKPMRMSSKGFRFFSKKSITGSAFTLRSAMSRRPSLKQLSQT